MTSTEPGYHRPAFPLFEAVFSDEVSEPRRWLSGWNGPITAPATDVTLAARGEGTAALVTSSPWAGVDEARVSGFLSLFAFRVPGLPDSTAELVRLAEDDGRWDAGTLDVDGRALPALTTTVGRVTIACCVNPTAGVGAAVAAMGAVALRRLVPVRGAAYPADPFVAHRYADLPPVDDIVG
ncbi:hypothetical protein ACIPVB_12045 [Microbacterium sp. NPDC090007]|uniref:hypothetical protein n=1 Tax=Microbacterium sp. NPDC090007 TaxID=3364204 RepID=UPI003828FE65